MVYTCSVEEQPHARQRAWNETLGALVAAAADADAASQYYDFIIYL